MGKLSVRALGVCCIIHLKLENVRWIAAHTHHIQADTHFSRIIHSLFSVASAAAVFTGLCVSSRVSFPRLNFIFMENCRLALFSSSLFSSLCSASATYKINKLYKGWIRAWLEWITTIILDSVRACCVLEKNTRQRQRLLKICLSFWSFFFLYCCWAESE